MKNIFIYLTFLIFMVMSVTLAGQDSQGFFLNDFCPKNATIPPYENTSPPKSKPTVTVTVHLADTIAKVSKYIYGNNANVYMTQMVTEPKLLNYIRQLSPHILRYPGGNLSSLFFWDAAPGELPADVPDPLYGGVDKRYKEEYWFGKNTSATTLSVDNYSNMLEQTNSTGIICVNYSYARYGMGPNPVQTAAKYAADWVRYDKGRTKFWEIGNENYGTWQAGYKIELKDNKDGQPEIITGELYGQHFKVFADSMRAAAREIASEIKIGAVLLEDQKEWHSQVEKNWNSGFFKHAGNEADFFVIHSYYTPWEENSTIPTILNSAEIETPKMMNYIKQVCHENGVIMKPVTLTEWNIFAIRSKQQTSYINGIHAALVLGELIKNKYGMSCRWNLANAWANGDDHGMFSQGDEPGVPKWNPRPVFYYMYYFQKFFGDHIVNTSVSSNSDVVTYASVFSSGEAGIVIVNKGAKNQTVQLQIGDFKYGNRYYLYSLIGGDDNGDFSLRVFVNGHGTELLSGGPPDVENIKALSAVIDKKIIIDLPAYSVQYVLVESNVN